MPQMWLFVQVKCEVFGMPLFVEGYYGSIYNIYNTEQLTVFQFQGWASTMESNLKRNESLMSNICDLPSRVIG